MKKIILLILISSTLLLEGCIPIYHVKDLSKSTTIDVVSAMGSTSDNPQICVNGKFYRLQSDSSGEARIPYGQRIILANNYAKASGYGVNYCKPQISFIPQQGVDYVLDFDVQGKDCRITVLQRNMFARGGFIVDRTARPDYCE